jgi:transcriptional regulator with XRE-family HTH domain
MPIVACPSAYFPNCGLQIDITISWKILRYLINMADRDTKAMSPTRIVWRRHASDQDVTERLGQQIRERREKAGLSLARASELSGITAAPLSRMETNKMSPTFSVLLKLMTGPRLSWTDLMGRDEAFPGEEFSIESPSAEQPTHIPGYAYLALHHSHAQRRGER